MSTTDQDLRAERAVVSLESIATSLEQLVELVKTIAAERIRRTRGSK